MKKHTFIVEINDTQSESWQGSVEWIQSHRKQSFRSAAELLLLMDSALEDKGKSWETVENERNKEP